MTVPPEPGNGLRQRFLVQQAFLVALGGALILLPYVGVVTEVVLRRNTHAAPESFLFQGWGTTLLVLAAVRWRLRAEWFSPRQAGPLTRLMKITPAALRGDTINSVVQRMLLNVNKDGIDPNGRR